MWIRIRSTWARVGDAKRFWLNFWIHVCMLVDTESMELKVSINGEEAISIKAEELRIQSPEEPKKALVLGKSDQEGGPRQFVGSVANVKFFMDIESFLKHMMNHLCTEDEKQWSDSLWLMYGQVQETEEDIQNICKENETYRVAIPTNISWNGAIQMCNTFGSGNLTEIKDPKDMEYTVNIFKNLNDHCENVWTALTDE